jgi:bifunctional UDP-N-acetylglucosamine pyrophosphorylase/glucosamine-1-phosphate N-acetyltransferase
MSEMTPPVAVIMAAGKSTRMKSRTPKVLHRIAGRPVIDYILDAAFAGCGIRQAIVIVGHEAESVQDYLSGRWNDAVAFARQEPQRGTGHAVMQTEPLLKDYSGDVLTMAGDTPLVTAEMLRKLVEHHQGTNAAATVLTAVVEEPDMYGRVVRREDGSVAYIVEAKDANEAERAVKEINTSIYCFRAAPLFRALREIRPENAQGEYYLTDVIALLARNGEKVEAVVSPDPAVVMGVNTRSELAEATTEIRARVLRRLMLDGVTIVDPANTYVDADVSVGQDTVIYPGSVIEGATTIGEDCIIGPNVHIVDCGLGRGVEIRMSRATLARIGDGVSVGPFANLRPGTVVRTHANIGSFVELKKADVGENASIAHLSYVGDATVGARANIGGGTITCNYDGFEKHPTTIGQDAFVGTNNSLVAPVVVGEGAYTAAGSTITDDVPPGSLAIGRARQTVKEGWADAWRAKHRDTDAED